MTQRGRFWAVGFDRIERAEQVRADVLKLGATRDLIVLDTAVMECFPDGIVTLDGKRFLGNISSHHHSFASFIAAIALGVPPLTEARVGELTRHSRTDLDSLGIDEFFVE